MNTKDQEIIRLLTIEKIGLHAAARQLGMNYGTLRYHAVKLGIHNPKLKRITDDNKAECIVCGNKYPLNEFPQLLSSGIYRCRNCIYCANPHYKELVDKYGEHCQICGIGIGHSKDCKLAVDHNHKTNKIRGLLCNRCNRGIGFMRDSIDLLQKAIEYLKTHQDEKID